MQPIIKKENILFDVKAKNKEEMINQMVGLFSKGGYLSDKDQFRKDVLAREEIFPTYIGFGIGVPHGKSKGVKNAGLCVAKLKNAIQWTDDEEADFIIMIAVGDEEKGEFHLQLLSKVTRLMMYEDFRNTLKNGTKESVYEALNKILEVA